MTDNEIIKALECCAKDDCERCPLSNYDGCKSLLFDGNIVIDLINRQKAEIETWKHKAEFVNYIIDKNIQNRIDRAKSEAIKEFAERLKEKIYSQVVRKKIDYTVEEMGGEE